MKKYFKSLMSIFLVITVVVSLAACAGSVGNNSSESDGGAAVNSGSNKKTEGSGKQLSWEEIKAQIPSELKGTTINMFNWNGENAVTGLIQVLSNFEKETGIKVNWETGTYDDYITKIIARVSSGDSPDIVRLRDTDISLIKVLTPLEDLNYDFTDEAWNQDLMHQYQVNGKHYGAIMNNTPYYQPLVLFYNRNLISRFKLEDPYDLWKSGTWTWNKCMEICETFLDAAGTNYTGLSLGDGTDYSHCLNTAFLTYDPDNNQYVSHMDDVNLVRAWQYVARNVSKGLISNTIFDVSGFEAETVLFANNSLIGARMTHFFFTKLKNDGALGVVPIPAVDGQKEYYQEMSENEAYAIPIGAKNAQAATYFLRYYLDADNYDMENFYCDEQAAEVAEWCKEQTNFFTMERIIYKDQYGFDRLNMSYRLRQTEPAQVKSALDTYITGISRVVSDGNKAIAELK